ncbi:exodeoxyribonuclease VII small subunit [bacterium]|nr:exodeoxyribonuclease VII small subunit [bacterium]
MEKKVKFEDKMKELEILINELETGEIDLDESIEKYTKAMKLIKECDTELKTVEKQISKLVTEENETEDFEIEEEH